MLTQIIAVDALMQLGRDVHALRDFYNISQQCGCPLAQKYNKKREKQGGITDTVNDDKSVNSIVKQEPKNGDDVKNISSINKESLDTDNKDSSSPLNFFADVALSKRDNDNSSEDSESDSDNKDVGNSKLRSLLKRPSKDDDGSAKKKPKLDTLDDVISVVMDGSENKGEDRLEQKIELKHFIR